MLYKEIIAVCSQIHTKHINTLCGAERRILDCYKAKDNSITDLDRPRGFQEV